MTSLNRTSKFAVFDPPGYKQPKISKLTINDCKLIKGIKSDKTATTQRCNPKCLIKCPIKCPIMINMYP